MPTLARLVEEVRRNAPAREAMSRIEASLAWYAEADQDAFWRAIDLYYVSLKAPGAETGPSGTRSDTIAAE